MCLQLGAEVSAGDVVIYELLGESMMFGKDILNFEINSRKDIHVLLKYGVQCH